MIVYVNEYEVGGISIPWFLRASLKQVKMHISFTKTKNNQVTLYGRKIHSIVLSDNTRWDAYNRVFNLTKDSLYDQLVKINRQIIDEWVKEGEEK